MISEEDKRFVAPCGLCCLDPYCPLLRSSEGKQVKALANKLDECIESNKYQDALAAWTAYQGFDKMMKILSTKAGTCEGCRSTIAAYPECSVRQCCLFDKKLNFCYQCSEFPCTKSNKLIDRSYANSFERKSSLSRVRLFS